MNYFEVYRDVWEFHKKYSEILDTDEYWNMVCSDGRAISKKYQQCEFVRALLLAVICELERIAKEARKGNEHRNN